MKVLFDTNVLLDVFFVPLIPDAAAFESFNRNTVRLAIRYCDTVSYGRP